MSNLSDLHFVKSPLDDLTRAGELYRALDDQGTLECFACGHRCVIRAGRRGICKVRYNERGVLRVPSGYVGALQCDPTEKKPFFHVYPGSDTLTFGMLGCDFHCGYCFTGDTFVMTNHGPRTFADLFESTQNVEQRADGTIAYPDAVHAVAASGTLRAAQKIFRHRYTGSLAIVQPLYLPALRCTPDHRLYATNSIAREPQPIQANQLTTRHYLAIPRTVVWYADATITRQVIETEKFYLVPIRSVDYVEYTGDVFNMEVENEHNYLANFCLVSNCQNWETSQVLRDPIATGEATRITPAQLVALAQRYGAQLIGSSYNEPLITSEWAAEVFTEARRAGLPCVYISNGNLTPEVLQYIRPHLVGYKIDLKTMRDKNYRQLGGVLQNVLDGIQRAHEAGLWVEIVTLIIPGFNDSDEELRDAARYIASVSRDIPWHVTAFHKDYKMLDSDNTDAKTLLRAAEIGQAAGLNFVYAGNLPGCVGDYEQTGCPHCHALLIGRYGYIITAYNLTDEGHCPRCDTAVAGLWGKRDHVRVGRVDDLFRRAPRSAR